MWPAPHVGLSNVQPCCIFLGDEVFYPFKFKHFIFFYWNKCYPFLHFTASLTFTTRSCLTQIPGRIISEISTDLSRYAFLCIYTVWHYTAPTKNYCKHRERKITLTSACHLRRPIICKNPSSSHKDKTKFVISFMKWSKGNYFSLQGHILTSPICVVLV